MAQIHQDAQTGKLDMLFNSSHIHTSRSFNIMRANIVNYSELWNLVGNSNFNSDFEYEATAIRLLRNLSRTINQYSLTTTRTFYMDVRYRGDWLGFIHGVVPYLKKHYPTIEITFVGSYSRTFSFKLDFK